jgi:tetratricopeptide (TPR) repeat protein
VKQSEHLSNAQIEQYGKRGPGAGPETEAWVDQHLDDCSSCRSRVLDFQRTRFALLPNQKVNTVPSSNCPSEDDLRNLAAGLYPDPKAAQLKAHSATCGHCGPLLQEYTEDFSDESSPDEQAFLNQLRTASPEFREQKARKMFEQEIPPKNLVIPEPVPSTDWRRFFSRKWILIPATAVIVLIAVGIWYLQRDTPEKAEKLLAQASSDRRTLEMRFPGAAYSSYEQTLSGDSESLLNSPDSLRQAANLINSQLKKNPEEPHWLLLSARLNLLDWRYKPALAILDKIDDPKIIGSADMRMTRALALYEQAQWEPERKDQSYGEIINLLGKTLQSAPDDTTALFNRALACEKIHAYECAAADFRHFLEHDAGTGWGAEASDHLKKIEEKKTSDH